MLFRSFEQALQFFAPFAKNTGATTNTDTPNPSTQNPASGQDSELQTLKEQLDNMQARLNDMEKGS